jgi:phage terminase small subunit
VSAAPCHKLTPKQAAFVAEYLIDLNATQAAIRAGYSAQTARQAAAENLSKPNIADAVQKAMDERAERTGITADQVLRKLASLGFSDIRRIFTPDGGLRSPTEMDEEGAAAIQSVEVITRRVPGNERQIEQIHKIRLADKLGALVQIGRHLGMFKGDEKPTAEVHVHFAADESKF